MAVDNDTAEVEVEMSIGQAVVCFIREAKKNIKAKKYKKALEHLDSVEVLLLDDEDETVQ
jgi:hypothetical protein